MKAVAMTLRKRLKPLTRPQVILPIALSVSLLIALVAFANVQKLASFMAGFRLVFIVPTVALLIAFEVIRGVVWAYLQGRTDIHVPGRALSLAYAVGEVTKYSPVGNYVPSYILMRARKVDLGRSAGATTVIPLMEVAICLAALVALGLGSWSIWLRPLILIGLAAFFAVLFIVSKLHLHPRAPRWLRRRGKIIAELREFGRGIREALHPLVLPAATLLTAIYLTVGATAFYLVILGLGVQLPYSQALAVYFFSLAVTLIIPVPTDIGSLEVSGSGALVVLGIARHQAVGIMLISRFFTLGVAILLAVAAAVVLRKELEATLRPRPD